MESLHLESVDIFDDFDDADIMQTSYCKLVLEEQYLEDMKSETDKALGELCLYLDKNPEVYSRVLRKRRQEEMESAGVISYVKSKMMSLLHGEQYPHCLVSASDCVQKTNALKSGMCKTFQLSRELNGYETRQSARLAAKKQAKIACSKSGDGQISDSSNAQDKCNTKTFNSDESQSLKSSGRKDVFNKSEKAQPVNLAKTNPSQVAVPSVSTTNYEMNNDELTSKQNDRFENSKTTENVNEEKTSSSTEATQSQLAELVISSSITIPSPPPAPPLPAYLTNSALPRHASHETQITRTGAKKISSRPNTPGRVKQEQRSSPRMHARKTSVEKGSSRANSLQNLSRLSQSDLSNMSSPFLTPDLPPRLRIHKRSQSNSSLNSISSCDSFSSVNSEILSNPVKRLKATQIIRSPGGTPARQKSNTLLSEPFHKALYTALKARFKNVNTPSPRSGNTSISASSNSMMNSTFSP